MSKGLIERLRARADMHVAATPATMLREAAARIRELEAELAALRNWDDHFRAVCGFKRDGRPSPECLNEFLAALAPVSVGEDDLRSAFIAGATAVHLHWQEQYEDGIAPPRDADFYEAADDYATAAFRALSETEGE